MAQAAKKLCPELKIVQVIVSSRGMLCGRTQSYTTDGGLQTPCL